MSRNFIVFQQADRATKTDTSFLRTQPPPRRPDIGPQDWAPYDNRLQFETAEFLYKRNQMSGGNIDILLALWAPLQVP